MAQAEVDIGSSLAPHATLLMPPRCPTGSVVTPHVGKRLSLKVDLAIYSYIVTVSGQYLSVAITLNNYQSSYRSCLLTLHLLPLMYLFELYDIIFIIKSS